MKHEYYIFNDIERNQKRNRSLVYLALGVVLITVIVSMVLIHNAHKQARFNAYVIQGGLRTPIEPITNSREQLTLLTEGHIRQFHELFFSLEPDLDHIRDNIEKRALYMIDNSGKRLYVRLVEKKYFHDVVTNDYRYLIELDSVVVDYSKYPFPFTYYGKQSIEKGKNTTYRNLFTKGFIKETGVTANNLNGMKIMDFEVINNSDVTK
tara:strand:+ start:11819 stop:12442 length:624 start_codon:yes stop_codon:yes gene_type:complete